MACRICPGVSYLHMMNNPTKFLLPHGEEIWICQDGPNDQGSVLWWIGIHGPIFVLEKCIKYIHVIFLLSIVIECFPTQIKNCFFKSSPDCQCHLRFHSFHCILVIGYPHQEPNSFSVEAHAFAKRLWHKHLNSKQQSAVSHFLYIALLLLKIHLTSSPGVPSLSSAEAK